MGQTIYAHCTHVFLHIYDMRSSMSSSFHLLEMSNNIYLEVIFLGFSHIPHVSGYRLRRALRLRHHTLRMLHNYVVRSHSHEEGRRWERCIFIQERGKEDLYEWGGNASTKAKERQREEIQNIQVICTTAVQCLSLLHVHCWYMYNDILKFDAEPEGCHLWQTLVYSVSTIHYTYLAVYFNLK